LLEAIKPRRLESYIQSEIKPWKTDIV